MDDQEIKDLLKQILLELQEIKKEVKKNSNYNPVLAMCPG